MRLLDSTSRALRWRVLFGAWLYLCLSLTGGLAQASTVTRQEAMPVAVAAMLPDSMPMAMDCAPCVRCYVAPVPGVQGFSGESNESQAPHWQVQATTQLETAGAISTVVWHLRLPVRIEFSRWLN